MSVNIVKSLFEGQELKLNFNCVLGFEFNNKGDYYSSATKLISSCANK